MRLLATTLLVFIAIVSMPFIANAEGCRYSYVESIIGTPTTWPFAGACTHPNKTCQWYSDPDTAHCKNVEVEICFLSEGTIKKRTYVCHYVSDNTGNLACGDWHTIANKVYSTMPGGNHLAALCTTSIFQQGCPSDACYDLVNNIIDGFKNSGIGPELQHVRCFCKDGTGVCIFY